MTLLGMAVSRTRLETATPKDAALKSCEELQHALNTGDVGAIAEKVQKLILAYYGDVQGQATESFASAKRVSLFGFALLLATVGYVVFIDLMGHIRPPWFTVTMEGMGVGTIGLISAGLVEFIAAVNFVLYSRATKQFGAFHICLERTHRYLLAYKIAERIGPKKDETLERLVCIMANAPMITRQDIDGVLSGRVLPTSAPTPDITSKDAKDGDPGDPR
jgi:hypothetical protein